MSEIEVSNDCVLSDEERYKQDCRERTIMTLERKGEGHLYVPPIKLSREVPDFGYVGPARFRRDCQTSNHIFECDERVNVLYGANTCLISRNEEEYIIPLSILYVVEKEVSVEYSTKSMSPHVWLIETEIIPLDYTSRAITKRIISHTHDKSELISAEMMFADCQVHQAYSIIVQK